MHINTVIVLLAVTFTVFLYFRRHIFGKTSLELFKFNDNGSGELNIIDLHETRSENISCIKTKLLLNVVRTTLCVHSDDDVISRIIVQTKIWEEELLNRLFRVLLLNPSLSFIDVGANIGVYTLFAAALNRFVLAIECFKPNNLRIAKAAQLQQVQDKIMLVQNAIFSESGKYIHLESKPSNIGGQATFTSNSMNASSTNPFTVKTIRFDAILPALRRNNVRTAIMRIDIEGSEHFLCNTGSQIFENIHIPVVQMEWEYIRVNKGRPVGDVVINFFIRYGYTPTKDLCQPIPLRDAYVSWPIDIYWVKSNNSNLC